MNAPAKVRAWGAGRKDALAWLFSRLGISSLARNLRFGKSRAFAVLAYHRVFDIGNEEENFPYDPELVSATVTDFSWQMEMLREHFNPMRVSDVLDCLDENRPIPPHAVIVTFDDGHGDNYTHAFPVLRRLGVPATIFLATGYLDKREPFWFDEVAYRLARTPRRELELRTLRLRMTLGRMSQRRLATQDVLASMKVVSDATRLAALRELAEASGIEAPVDDPGSRPLTWEQVGEMMRGGIDFGSHGVSHPVFARLGDEELHRELAVSKRELERRLGRKVESIAYPVGMERSFDQRVTRMARELGYRLGFTYESGINAWPAVDTYRLRRMPVERHTTRTRFEGMLAFPRLFEYARSEEGAGA